MPPNSATSQQPDAREGAPTLVDNDRLDRWLRDKNLKSNETLRIKPIKGGTSQAMFAVDCGTNRWVLRRPKAVALERAEQGLRREFRILSALADCEVPAPRLIALCEDPAVVGALFYLMERVDGFPPSGNFPPEFTRDPQTRAQTALAGIDALAKLHRIDWRAHGLDDFGRPEDFHQRQSRRWIAQFEGYQGRELPGLSEVAAWLPANAPKHWQATIMHGDYHPLNLLMSPTMPARITAIVDWETATIGDPFLDLVSYIERWGDVQGAGWPSPAAFVECYLQQSGRSPHNLAYYVALYSFRLAIMLEGIYQRALKDDAQKPQELVGDMALRTMKRALQAIEKPPQPW